MNDTHRVATAATEASRKRLRVLYVLGHGGLGGIERHVETLLRCCDRTQVEPFLCVVMEAGAVSDAIAAAGVPVTVLGARNGHDMRLLPRFLRLLDSVRPDVVHTHELQFGVALAMWLRPGVPLLHSLHCAVAYGPRPWWSYVMGHTLGRRVDRFLPVSQATWRESNRYAGRPSDRGTVFYNPIDLATLPRVDRAGVRREFGWPEETRLLGMVGRLAEQKDWPAFLSICRRVVARCPDVRILAVGDGPLRAHLHASEDARQMATHLVWTGGREDARRLIGALDVFLLTSRHEELPTTLLEALALGAPVAGFLPPGGTREVLDLAGASGVARLEEARDCERAARQVVQLLDDPELRRRQAAAARQLVETHFDARRNCRRLIDIYRGELAARRRSV